MAFKDRFLELDHLMQWQRGQWSQAAGWFENSYGWLPLPTIEGASRVSSGWYNRRPDEPAPQQILVVDFEGWLKPTLPANDVWARRLFAAARRELYPLKLECVAF